MMLPRHTANWVLDKKADQTMYTFPNYLKVVLSREFLMKKPIWMD